VGIFIYTDVHIHVYRVDLTLRTSTIQAKKKSIEPDVVAHKASPGKKFKRPHLGQSKAAFGSTHLSSQLHRKHE
jgi:hypothetical protein